MVGLCAKRKRNIPRGRISIKMTILLLAYLLGSLPTGFIVAKLISGIDIREVGSGSTGATNVLRHVGKFPALLVFLIDVGKGTSAVLISKELTSFKSLHAAAGLIALVGHIWPIWLKWKGGKAVATGLGMFLGLSWNVGLGALSIFIIVFLSSKLVSLSSIIAALSLPILMIINLQSDFKITYFLISLIAMLIVIWRHRSNIKRILNGTEPKINISH